MKLPPYEVVIPTRGDVEAVSVGLVPHAAAKPFRVRFVTAKMPEGGRSLMAVEMLRRLGCPVTVELQQRKGIGAAHAQAIRGSYHPSVTVLIWLDDDIVVTPVGALDKLAKRAMKEPWVNPVIRFASNFNWPSLDHEEVWDVVSPDDPRVGRACARYGPGWMRVYDVGRDQRSDQLGGGCYAARLGALRRSGVADELWDWSHEIGGSDSYIGKALGRSGVILSGVYGYHWGHFTAEKWGFGEMGRRMILEERDAFSRMAKQWTR